MAEQSKFSSAPSALAFIRGGNARVTLRSTKSGQRYTYQLRKTDFAEDKFFIALLTGPDNEADYTYLGMLYGERVVLTKKSKMSYESPPVRALAWAMARLGAGSLPAELEIWHEGRCGACGRTLTVPQSIETGFGPECAARRGLGKPEAQALNIAELFEEDAA